MNIWTKLILFVGIAMAPTLADDLRELFVAHSQVSAEANGGGHAGAQLVAMADGRR